MNFKKNVRTILFSTTLTSIALCNFVFAEPATIDEPYVGTTSKVEAVDSLATLPLDNSSNLAVTTTETQLLPAVNVALQADSPAEKSAVSKDGAERKHFWQVLWLKGKVKQAKEEPVQEPQPSKLKGWIEGNYATGDWGGLRGKLEDHGVVISSYYLSDSFNKFNGGSQGRSAARTFGYVETNLAVDTGKLGLWKGGKFDVRYGNKHGTGVSRDLLGESLGIDAYDYREFNQVEEYYYEQSMFSDRVKIKVGKQDASFDIAALASGLNFLGNSFAYIPTTAPLPYYPEPAMGTLLTLKPTNWLSLKTGFYDGNGKGGKSGFDTVFGENRSTLFVEELGIKHNLNNHPGNYFAGYTLHTAHKDELADTVSHTYSNNPSMYLGGEQMIYKENKDDAADDQGLTMLGQFGWTPSDRNKLCQYYGTGLQYKGLISNRNSDIVGIGTSIGKFSDRLQNMTSDGRQGTESIIEMFYKFQLNKWLAVVPDLQVVIHPGAQQKNSFLMGLRFTVTL